MAAPDLDLIIPPISIFGQCYSLEANQCQTRRGLIPMLLQYLCFPFPLVNLFNHEMIIQDAKHKKSKRI